MVRWRVNGFEKPHTLDQMFTWIIYPLITAAYYFIFAFNIKEWERYLYLLLPHSFVVILLLICWFAVEYIDPSDSPGKTGIPVVCFRPLEVKARYCGNCRKLVYGLDHHCTWLNTCVGRRNYVPFFTLVVAGTIQLIIEVITDIFIMTIWLNERNETRIVNNIGTLWVYYLLISLHGFVALILGGSFMTLLIFHLYLLLIARVGTYDWLLGNRSTVNNPRLETHPRLDSQSDKNSNNNQQISIKSIETEIVRVSPRAALQDDTSNQSTSIDLFKSGNTEEAAV